MGGPPPKAKYYPVTDSGQYREGKVKRTPGGEWNRNWNPVLTSSRSASDGVLFVERANELWCAARLSASGAKPQGNRVLRGRVSCMLQTRNRVTYPWPGWSTGKTVWRTEPVSVEKGLDELWIAVKFQSNTEIAGSPRNSFRASVTVNTCGGRALNWLGIDKITEPYQTPNAVR